jgi:hypothetical protein
MNPYLTSIYLSIPLILTFLAIVMYWKYRYRKLEKKTLGILTEYEEIIKVSPYSNDLNYNRYHKYLNYKRYKSKVWTFNSDSIDGINNTMQLYTHLIKYIEKEFSDLDYFITLNRENVINDLLK